MLGFVGASFVDVPGKIASTVFFPGCDFRCPFCHNPELVNGTAPCEYFPEQCLAIIQNRAHLIEAVCFSGGEPLLHEKILREMITKIKAMNLFVKLDTNGTHPALLAELLESGQIDYVAMDIKSSKARYAKASGLDAVDLQAICDSVDLLKQGYVDYEFRTTVVPSFFTEADALSIGEWLRGSKKYVLQQYSNRKPMLDPGMRAEAPYPPGKLSEFQALLAPYVGRVEVRGV
jgi:pyruvate formate lyase activating enzyme